MNGFIIDLSLIMLCSIRVFRTRNRHKFTFYILRPRPSIHSATLTNEMWRQAKTTTTSRTLDTLCADDSSASLDSGWRSFARDLFGMAATTSAAAAFTVLSFLG